MYKFVIVILIVLMNFLFITCNSQTSSKSLESKYNCVKTNETFNLPILSYQEANNILYSLLHNQNRKIEYVNENIIIILSNENVDYNIKLIFLFKKNENRFYYLGSNREVDTDKFIFKAKGTSLITKENIYQCITKGYMYFNKEGDIWCFPFTVVANTNFNNIFITTFEYKYNS